MAPPTKVKKGKADVAKGKAKGDAVKSKVRSAALTASPHCHALSFSLSTFSTVHLCVLWRGKPFPCDGTVAAAWLMPAIRRAVQAHTVLARHCVINSISTCLLIPLRAVLSRLTCLRHGPAAQELCETELLKHVYLILHSFFIAYYAACL